MFSFLRRRSPYSNTRFYRPFRAGDIVRSTREYEEELKAIIPPTMVIRVDTSNNNNHAIYLEGGKVLGEGWLEFVGDDQGTRYWDKDSDISSRDTVQRYEITTVDGVTSVFVGRYLPIKSRFSFGWTYYQAATGETIRFRTSHIVNTLILQ